MFFVFFIYRHTTPVRTCIYLYPAYPSAGKHIPTELLARFSSAMASETVLHHDNALPRVVSPNEARAADKQRWCT